MRWFLALLVWVPSVALAQSNALFCAPTAAPVVVRSEGLSERLGDVFLNCSGAPAGTVVSANLVFFLSVNITNRVSSSGAADIFLTIDTGSGPVPAPRPAVVTSTRTVVFNGVQFTVPTSGKTTLRLSNLRGAVNSQGADARQPIQLQLSSAGSTNLATPGSALTVGIPSRALLATYSSSGVRCVNSGLPREATMTQFFAAGTRFFSARITEGFATAFEIKSDLADSGTRLLVRYSGFPEGASLFVPDLVAGSSAIQPTAGGDLGTPQSPGQWAPSPAGSLLLARVPDAAADGSGGTPLYRPGGGAGHMLLDAVKPVPLRAGSGFAVYEVVDSQASVRESAQIPTFYGLSSSRTAIASVEILLAPLSTDLTASPSAPVPRFAAVAPPSDCSALNDCDAAFFPRLSVTAQALDFRALANSAPIPKPVFVNNTGGGVLNWTVTVAYKSGSDWLLIENPGGVNNATVRLWAQPQKVTPGTYEAVLTIDAGPLAGSRSAPVTFTVTPLPPVEPELLITTVANLADPEVTTLAPGAQARVRGVFPTGGELRAALDSIPATLLRRTANLLEIRVPPELAGRSSAQLLVTAGNARGVLRTVTLAEVAPAIFPDGIYNSDNTLNSADHPAPPGSVFQVFLTGLLAPVPGRVEVRIHDRVVTPVFAGPLQAYPGVDQVNVAIPDDLPAMVTEMSVCGFASSQPGRPVCSRPARIALGSTNRAAASDEDSR